MWLCEYPDTHILPDGLYVSAATDGTVTVTAEIERPSGESVAELTLRTEIYENFGDEYPIEQLESRCCAVDKSFLPDVVTR